MISETTFCGVLVLVFSISDLFFYPLRRSLAFETALLFPLENPAITEANFSFIDSADYGALLQLIFELEVRGCKTFDRS